MKDFRFVKRNSEFRWVHRYELAATDLDCTGMTDEQFEAVVLGAAA